MDASAAEGGATVLALLVPVSKRDPLRLVPLAACDPALPNYGQQCQRYVADLRSIVGGYLDMFPITGETLSPTQLVGYVHDQVEGHCCNEWWHEAAASATVVPLADVYGALVIAAESPRSEASSASITDWRNDDGGTFCAESWTDCDFNGPFLLRVLCGYLERLEIQRRISRRQLLSLLRPGTQVFDGRVTPAQAQVCVACCANNKPLFVCPRCSSVLYCSPECQNAHWPRHQEHCRHMNANTA